MTKTLDDKARRHMERTDAINAALEQLEKLEELVKAPGTLVLRIEAMIFPTLGLICRRHGSF